MGKNALELGEKIQSSLSSPESPPPSDSAFSRHYWYCRVEQDGLTPRPQPGGPGQPPPLGIELSAAEDPATSSRCCSALASVQDSNPYRQVCVGPAGMAPHHGCAVGTVGQAALWQHSTPAGPTVRAWFMLSCSEEASANQTSFLSPVSSQRPR